MSAPAGGRPRVLHIHGSLRAADPQAVRCVRLIEAFGGRLRHAVVAADGDFSALAGVTKGIAVDRLAAFPPLGGLPLPGRLQRIARAMQGHDLVLTYGRGAIMAALAHTSFGEVHALPPLIHHEDGSDETAAQRRSLRSIWLRRVAMGRAAGLVVPSETMEAAALVQWQQPLGRVKVIADGVDLTRFEQAASGTGLGRLIKRTGERWIGCFAGPDTMAGLPPLVERVAGLGENWHLVIIGPSGVHDAVDASVTRHGINHRVHAVTTAPDRAKAIAPFDIVALIPSREPVPIVAIEAMAAGLPVVGLDEREAAAVLSPDNAALGDSALEALSLDEDLRRAVGMANRKKARIERGEEAMIAAYRRLYASAMQLDTI